MRSAAQIGRTVDEWRDREKAQRERTLRALLRELEQARAQRAEWYVWISEGQPELTPAQYAPIAKKRARALRTKRQGANA